MVVYEHLQVAVSGPALAGVHRCRASSLRVEEFHRWFEDGLGSGVVFRMDDEWSIEFVLLRVLSSLDLGSEVVFWFVAHVHVHSHLPIPLRPMGF